MGKDTRDLAQEIGRRNKKIVATGVIWLFLS